MKVTHFCAAATILATLTSTRPLVLDLRQQPYGNDAGHAGTSSVQSRGILPVPILKDVAMIVGIPAGGSLAVFGIGYGINKAIHRHD
ncbi:hypothetical protein OC845_003145 [Tilletia horrida]|nr:hypothetical protein OC845_003145 [Tilletia horrida]